MKTGKFIFGFICTALIAVSLTGCFSLPPGKITIDTELPHEKTAVVVFSSAIYVKEYNGIDVKDTWYPKNIFGDDLRKMTITMPAGETHLLFNIYASWSRGNTTYTFRPKDLELKFDFEAGKEYSVSLYAGKNEGNFLFPKQKVILAIWDQTGKNELKSWEIGEF